jgi:hypothetical protein
MATSPVACMRMCMRICARVFVRQFHSIIYGDNTTWTLLSYGDDTTWTLLSSSSSSAVPFLYIPRRWRAQAGKRLTRSIANEAMRLRRHVKFQTGVAASSQVGNSPASLASASSLHARPHPADIKPNLFLLHMTLSC